MISTLRDADQGSNLSGLWRIDLPRRGGVTLHTYFLIKPHGAAFEGSVIMNDAVEIPMLNPRFEDGDGVFETSWETDFRLRPVDGRLCVKIIYRKGGMEEAIAIPVAETEIQFPPGLPLPDFAPLPPNGMALTPPMGWNSWNHFAERIDDQTVREMADAMVSTGLAAAGYVYINIDDAWAGGRNPDGTIQPNTKFPDMKALADYVHAKGLKLGLYSSPGARTCGGYEGSYGHEEQDAKSFAQWGVDYLKYDWCGAARMYGYSRENLRAAYLKMGRALARCGRPIIYSICEYGLGEVEKWGPQVGGNLWRTTGDIRDTWRSMSDIGFSQSELAPAAGPGRWNDPDMLEVGNGGMTPTEYRTHFSLWCLLAAPLVAGNDLRNMSADTKEILMNLEVIAVDQDPLGEQGRRVLARDGIEIWTKPLQGGALAIGVFNRNDEEKTGGFTWQELKLPVTPGILRDLWAHRDLRPDKIGFSDTIPAHGTTLLRAR